MSQRIPMTEVAADPGLPELCYSADPGDGVLAAIKRGEDGYYPVDRYPTQAEAEDAAERHNKRLGVSPEQKMAMVMGSMFGWNHPRAKLTKT